MATQGSAPDAPPQRSLRIALVTGIYPPDIGGPATHAADLADELRRRGHAVVAVTLWDGPLPNEQDHLVRFPRRWPWTRRLAAVTLWLVRRRGLYDVVYALGLHPAAVVGARFADRPVVVKIVGDPAWERGRRLGLVEHGFDDFQSERSGPLRVRAMRALRDWSVCAATAVTVPSEYLGNVVRGWTQKLPPVHVIPNGVRAEATMRRGPAAPGTLDAVFVGRLVEHKRVDLLLEAIAGCPGTRLEVIGDGPERANLVRQTRALRVEDRVRFTGSLPHGRVLQRMRRGADVLVSASTYEGLPHTVIEALTCGIPVIATPAGGTGEAIRHGLNGLLVQEPTSQALASALHALRTDGALLRRLSEGAVRTALRWRFERCADQVEELLRAAASPKPRAIFVGKTLMPRELGSDLQRKLATMSRCLEATILAVGPVGTSLSHAVRIVRFPSLRPPIAGGALFYSLASMVAVGLAAGRRDAAIVCQSPYEAAGILGLSRLLPTKARPPVVVELHGDWRAASRLYGARARRLLSGPADRVAAWALRRADRVRVISDSVEQMALEAGYTGALFRFPTFSDFRMFLAEPVVVPPFEPRVLFAGVLAPSKGVDVLIDAWPLVLARIPEARLTIAGDGQLRERLRRRAFGRGCGASIEFIGAVPRAALRDLLDRCSCLVLPSRTEALGRVVIEAMARARPVVASAVGGVPELVEDGRTGSLVPPEDPVALAGALVKLLEDRNRAEQAGRAGRDTAERLDPAGRFEAGMADLASWIGARR